MTHPPVRVAVIGVGRMGANHARVYSEIPEAKLVAVCDPNAARAGEIAEKHGCRAAADYRELLGLVDAVTVATPTVQHCEVARAFLEAGAHVLVEKPIATDSGQARELVEAARAAGLQLAVGHVERFNPAVVAAQKLIRNPRYIESDRISPYPFRSMDIGVVMDLMIHDLDIILHLVDSPVARVEALGVNVLSSTEDVANARIVFENGCVANVTASRVSMKRLRKIRVFQDDAYISLDYDAKQGMIFRKTFPDGIAGFEAGPELFKKSISVDEIPMEEFEPLKRELETFVRCVRTGENPPVTGRHGLRALELAERIRAAMAIPPASGAGA